MIRELHIKNIALIDDATISFTGGFCIFTGETGAGKSILLGAIGLLLGERAATDLIRSGTDDGGVQGVFELPHPSQALLHILDEQGISLESGSTLIIKRDLSRSGRGRIVVNGIQLTQSVLKAIGDVLVDFHGQHDHQLLLRDESARELINSIDSVTIPAQAYALAWTAYCQARETLAAHDARLADLQAKKDLLEFQYNELNALKLRAGEDTELEEELTLLSSSTQRQEGMHKIFETLSEEGDDVVRKVGLIRKQLESLSRFDASLSQLLPEIDNAQQTLAELERSAGTYLHKNGGNANPKRIEDINARLAKLQRLKKKYLCDHNGLLNRHAQLKTELNSLQNNSAEREDLAIHCATAEKACQKAGETLSASRKKAAHSFDRSISATMTRLGFTNAAFRTDFTILTTMDHRGLEECLFSVRTNPGEPFLPLSKTASGGEISRIMLAIKTVLTGADQVPVLIFDEIDTGIGGLIANEVAAALKALAATHQVLCITHLHQIARLADNHYVVAKEHIDKRTVTRVCQLDHQQRVLELSRMLGGESEITRKHAEMLLKTS